MSLRRAARKRSTFWKVRQLESLSLPRVIEKTNVASMFCEYDIYVVCLPGHTALRRRRAAALYRWLARDLLSFCTHPPLCARAIPPPDIQVRGGKSGNGRIGFVTVSVTGTDPPPSLRSSHDDDITPRGLASSELIFI